MNRVTILSFLFAVAFPHTNVNAQVKTDPLLQSILLMDTNKILSQVVKDPQTYRCQVIYTQINRDRNNRPHFINYYFNYDANNYFNPASTVKLPLAFLALEKLNKMKVKGVNKYTPIQFDSSYERQTTAYRDSTSANQLPSIAHYIKRAFLISENDPYNRLYQFLDSKPSTGCFMKRDIRISGSPGNSWASLLSRTVIPTPSVL